MIRQSGKWYTHIIIAILLTLAVWYGQASFDLAADYTLRADFFVTQGQLAVAEDYYEQAAKHDPQNANHLYQLGLFYIEQGQYDKAFDVLVQADEMGYDDTFSVQYQIGRAAYYQWQYPIAAQYLEAALLQVDVETANYSSYTHASLLTLLGWSYLQEIECETAILHFEAALQISADARLARTGLRRCT